MLFDLVYEVEVQTAHDLVTKILGNLSDEKAATLGVGISTHVSHLIKDSMTLTFTVWDKHCINRLNFPYQRSSPQ